MPDKGSRGKALDKNEPGRSRRTGRERTMTGWHVGDTLRHTSTGKLRRVVRITPAGSAGTRVSDGPVWHARVVDENGDDIPSGHTADIWRGSLSYPAADWRRVRFYGGCGVPDCPDCLPLYDIGNREIPGTDDPAAAAAYVARMTSA